MESFGFICYFAYLKNFQIVQRKCSTQFKLIRLLYLLIFIVGKNTKLERRAQSKRHTEQLNADTAKQNQFEELTLNVWVNAETDRKMQFASVIVPSPWKGKHFSILAFVRLRVIRSSERERERETSAKSEWMWRAILHILDRQAAGDKQKIKLL